MTDIIKLNRRETLTKGGVGLLRFLEYLENVTEQVNETTSSSEADPSSINLSAALISSITKLVKELQNTIDPTNTAEVSRLKKRIEELQSDTLTPVTRNKFKKLTVKDLNVTSELIGPSGAWDSTSLNLNTGITYQINGIAVLSSSALGVNVLASSLTSLGTITGFNASTNLSVNGTQVVGVQQGAIASPAGGATIDAESRTAIDAIRSALSAHGLTA